jgi:hypothetical protein
MKSFEEQQQELVDLFKNKMSKAFEGVISKFYCDVTPYADHDASINFKNALRDEVFEELTNEIKSENSNHSWAHSIRMALLKNHKEELQNKIIEDLMQEIESLKKTICGLYDRY